MPEIDFSSFFSLFIWSIVLLWTAGFIRTAYCLKRQPVLEPGSGPETNGRRPSVSIIVPARNEAGRVLEKSISSMLDQDYPVFELIILNDRSTDDTQRILEKIASRCRPSSIRILTGTEPPDGWLGKPYALEQAYREASGEWILTADADIIFSPTVLETVIGYAEKKNLDALTLIPKLSYGTIWEKFFLPVFGWFCILRMPLHLVNDPDRSESMGIGNFFLFRRRVLERIGGFKSVRREIAEDLKLAEIIKKDGFRLRIEYAPELLRTRMYAGFSEIWSGFTKNLFSGMKFSAGRTLLGAGAILIFGVLPVFAGLTALGFGESRIFIPLVLVYLLQTLTLALVYREWKSPIRYALLAPLGMFLFALILLNSMIKVLSGRGVSWKGRTIYGPSGVRPPAA